MIRFSEGQPKTSRISRFLNDRIEEIKGDRNQREIADIAGYANQNMITMLKQGKSKVALDRVSGLAKALGVDSKDLMRMALEQFYDLTTIREIEQHMGAILTVDELVALDLMREHFGGAFPKATSEFKEKLKAALSTM